MMPLLFLLFANQWIYGAHYYTTPRTWTITGGEKRRLCNSKWPLGESKRTGASSASVTAAGAGGETIAISGDDDSNWAEEIAYQLLMQQLTLCYQSMAARDWEMIREWNSEQNTLILPCRTAKCDYYSNRRVMIERESSIEQGENKAGACDFRALIWFLLL